MKNARRLPNICKNTQQINLVVFLRSFISALIVFVLFSAPSFTEMKFQGTFPYFPFFFRGFSKPLPNRRRTRLLCCRRTLLARGGRTRFALVETFRLTFIRQTANVLHVAFALRGSRLNVQTPFYTGPQHPQRSVRPWPYRFFQRASPPYVSHTQFTYELETVSWLRESRFWQKNAPKFLTSLTNPLTSISCGNLLENQPSN